MQRRFWYKFSVEIRLVLEPKGRWHLVAANTRATAREGRQHGPTIVAAYLDEIPFNHGQPLQTYMTTGITQHE